MLTPVVEVGPYWLKDETVVGGFCRGAKVRQFSEMAKEQPGAAMVVGCSAVSAMQCYLTEAARAAGVPAHVFTSQRAVWSRETKWASDGGATIHQVRPGYLSTIRARARAFVADELGGVCVRWQPARAIEDTATQTGNIPEGLPAIVVPVGSGLVAAGVLCGLARRKPQARRPWLVVGVAVSGMTSSDDVLGAATKAYGGPMPPWVVYQHVPPMDEYEKPLYGGVSVPAAIQQHGYLDPYYSAKAARVVPLGGLLWVSGRRPVSLCLPGRQ